MVMLPAKPVADYLAGVLQGEGYHTAVATSVDDAFRLIQFVRFDVMVAWVPVEWMQLFHRLLEHRSPDRPSLVMLSWLSEDWFHCEPWFDKRKDQFVSLPLTLTALIEAVQRAGPRFLIRTYSGYVPQVRAEVAS